MTALRARSAGRLAKERERPARAVASLSRLLGDIDSWITDHDLDDDVGPPERADDTRLARNNPLTLDLTSGEVNSIVWATGFRPDLSWVELPVFDSAGQLRHDGGVVDAPGVYFLGATFLRRRKSSFIHGADDDTRDLVEHLDSVLAAPYQRLAAK